jgi:hypothetical protein
LTCSNGSNLAVIKPAKPHIEPPATLDYNQYAITLTFRPEVGDSSGNKTSPSAPFHFTAGFDAKRLAHMLGGHNND